jgi:hypothetical protein
MFNNFLQKNCGIFQKYATLPIRKRGDIKITNLSNLNFNNIKTIINRVEDFEEFFDEIFIVEIKI